MRNIARFVALFLVFQTGSALADKNTATPNAELSPSDVMHIIIDALKSNDSSKNDDGIATVFEFASPSNKQMTGPLPRFTIMIKRGFGEMLNHIDSELGAIEIQENIALQSVWLTSGSGTETGYVFQLGKQMSGDFKGMWMTDSVWPIGTRKPKGQSI